ncbi:hypothetical protein HY440_02795, partial [Candidatus Microgenomates bacterium]|nr:hypothetical protein [Candidatus Microgenomates bacterium]
LFMTTEYSRFIWERIQLLWYLQFPWRFLEFAVLFSSLLAGAFVFAVKKRFWQLVLAAGLVVSVIYLHGKYFTPQTFFPSASDASELSAEQTKWTVSQTSFEYMPKGIAVRPTPQGSYVLDVDRFPGQNYRLLSGDFQPAKSQFDPGKFNLSGNSQSGAAIEFQITNFPGWKVWVDNQETLIDDGNKLKLITVIVPPGSHQITGRFTDTPARLIGNLVSLSAIIGMGLILFYGRKRLKT